MARTHMRSSTATMLHRVAGTAALAGALWAAAALPALAAPPGNLLADPGAEVAPVAAPGGNLASPQGWTASIAGSPGNQGPYASCYGGGANGERLVVDRSVGDAIDGGARVFFGGQVDQATLQQDIGVTPGDVAGRTLLVGGDFGGYEGQADDVTLAVHFLDAGGAELGSPVATAPVSATDRGYQTSLLLREARGTVPAGTSTLRAVLTQTRHEGTDNDGYADNLYVTFDATAPARATPAGDAGCPLAQAPPPVPGPAAAPPALAPPVVAPPAKKPPAHRKPSLAGIVRGLPPTKRCVSRRAFRIRLRNPKGTRIAHATVKVNHRTVATRKGKRVTAPVNLRGLPKGRYTVSITARLADHRTVKGARHYRTCAKRRHHA